MQVVTQCFASRGEECLVPLQPSFRVPVARWPPAVDSREIVPEFNQSKFNEALRTSLNLILGREAIVRIVRVPSHGRRR